MKVESESEVAQLCPTLSDPTDCSLPGSSVHGIFQARVLEWGAIAFSWRRIDTCIYTAESLCHPPETITTLLINYTPIQNKNLIKNTFEETAYYAHFNLRISTDRAMIVQPNCRDAARFIPVSWNAPKECNDLVELPLNYPWFWKPFRWKKKLTRRYLRTFRPGRSVLVTMKIILLSTIFKNAI